MDDGNAKKVTAHSCAVDKMLMSVSKTTSKGDRVTVDGDGGSIENNVAGEDVARSIRGYVLPGGAGIA